LQIVVPAIEGGHSADAAIAEQCRDASQISGFDAHVAIGDNQQVVPRLTHQAAKIGDFGVRAQPLRRHNQMDGAPRKVRDQFLQHGHDRILGVTHSKQNFEFRIVLPAKTREVFVRFGIQAANGLEYADRRRVFRRERRLTVRAPGRTEKSPRRTNSGEVVKQRAERQSQNKPT